MIATGKKNQNGFPNRTSRTSERYVAAATRVIANP
jgi:hypothetical protein